MNLTEQLTAALERGYCPTAAEIKDLCTALHSAMVEADERGLFREFMWMDKNFEDMADVMHSAIRCEASSELEAA